MRMPFGKFKGLALEECPLEYLFWLSENIELREPLCGAVHRQIEARATSPEPLAHPQRGISVNREDAALVKQIVDAGYRSIATRIHPDAGGSTADMQRLNAIVSSLRSQLADLAPSEAR